MCHSERAPLGKIWIVIHSRNLEPREFELAGFQRQVAVNALSLKSSKHARVDTGDRLRRGNHGTRINRLPKREVVRMEDPQSTVRQDLVAEDFKQRALNIFKEVIRLNADSQVDLQRHINRAI